MITDQINHTHPSHNNETEEHKLEHDNDHQAHHGYPQKLRGKLLNYPKCELVPQTIFLKSKYPKHEHSKHKDSIHLNKDKIEYNKYIQKYKNTKIFPVYDGDELSHWGHRWNDCVDTQQPKWSKYKIKTYTPSLQTSTP